MASEGIHSKKICYKTPRNVRPLDSGHSRQGWLLSLLHLLHLFLFPSSLQPTSQVDKPISRPPTNEIHIIHSTADVAKNSRVAIPVGQSSHLHHLHLVGFSQSSLLTALPFKSLACRNHQHRLKRYLLSRLPPRFVRNVATHHVGTPNTFVSPSGKGESVAWSHTAKSYSCSTRPSCSPLRSEAVHIMRNEE
jgi:hypothetical protein